MRTFLLAVFTFPFFVLGQIPPGYYNPAAGLTGTQLLVALHNIIDNHTVVSYNGLWNAYEDTDRKSNGKVWDIYTDIPGGTPVYTFNFGSDQCGSYSVEGDCYNREHTWPQSWFNSVSGPTSDLFHVYPTDGKVNGERDNFPYGNVGSPVYFVSSNGSQLGISNDLGYSLVVFEPIDGYKGDVARNYFYMSTRYYSEDASWASSGATVKSDIKDWQLNVLLKWHHDDPVSPKETARNNTIYDDYQHNRNPFIDHPEWADSIWGERVENFIASVGLEEQETENISLYPNPAKEKFHLESGNVNAFTLEIRDLHGRRIEPALQSENGLISVDCSSWENGVYFIQLVRGNSVKNFHFIKAD
ncbi:MAG: bsn 2 [Crocinitomicaceae bacterium]|jgi:endonuclease I|nr:bsn 2 [Crocinitomicaceae bacterium]